MVLLLVLGLMVSALLSYVVQFNDVDQRVADELQQEVEEFESLAGGPLNPVTGRPWSDLDDVLGTLITTSAPEEHQYLLGFVDDRLVATQDSSPRLELDGEPRAISAILATPAPGYGTTMTRQGPLAFAVVPVEDPVDTRRGLLVATYATDGEYDEVTGTIFERSVVYGAVVVVAAATGWLLLGRLLAPLAQLRAATASVDDTDLSRRIHVRGNDEVSDLGHRFNAMLDRLEAAFTTQRDLLDDVGHELKTPLTIVRGHLDLIDPGNPNDVAQTRALVLDELDRMSHLVDDLITLARAERPDFVRPAPVDATVLTDEVAQKLTGLADRDWRIDDFAAGRVVLDRARVTQALLQLASNAVAHTRPGGVVAVGSRRVPGARADADRLLMWVRDTGPGVAPRDEEMIFARFGRGGGETRDSGTGLGLAIVQAIAAGHDGAVRLENAPSEGATFVLDLPWRDDGMPHGETDPDHDRDRRRRRGREVDGGAAARHPAPTVQTQPATKSAVAPPVLRRGVL